MRRRHANRISAIFDELLTFGATVSVDPQTDFLKINSEYSASLILARCRQASGGNYRWHLRFDESLDPDIITAARLLRGRSSFWSTNLPQLGIVAMHHCRWSELMVAFWHVHPGRTWGPKGGTRHSRRSRFMGVPAAIMPSAINGSRSALDLL